MNLIGNSYSIIAKSAAIASVFSAFCSRRGRKRTGEGTALRMTAEEARRQISELLLDWCDALVRLQINKTNDPRLDGGILCPACGCVHGRCHEAVYPLLWAAHTTGNESYLTAARRLFDWGENVRCADGGFRNDLKSEWKGVTVFAAVALHDALFFHGALLTAAEKARWEARLLAMGEWLSRNLTEQSSAYLNYLAANASAMALLGNYFSNEEYLSLAKRLAAFCLGHITQSSLICGEGHPRDAVSPKGCRAVDVGGYNVEETLPSLSRYAAAAGDRKTAEACCALWRAHLAFLLPDGAWDDSTGTRSFKWSYWGSRTADGCQGALFALGAEDPVFAEAAWRNFALYRRCTFDGLLAGGPDYRQNGEPACVHHTFCHAKALAATLDGPLPAFARVPVPSDHPSPLTHYPELDAWRAACGKWRLSVSGCDVSHAGARHVSGGCISLLWHADAGPLIAVGQMDQTLREPHNQQLSVHPETQGCGCPRLETTDVDAPAGQQFCRDARLSASQTADGVVIRADACLCFGDGRPLPGGAFFVEYRLTQDALVLCVHVPPALSASTRFVLPLIGDAADVSVLGGSLICAPARRFHLSPGFLCREYSFRPDSAGHITISISVRSASKPRDGALSDCP